MVIQSCGIRHTDAAYTRKEVTVCQRRCDRNNLLINYIFYVVGSPCQIVSEHDAGLKVHDGMTEHHMTIVAGHADQGTFGLRCGPAAEPIILRRGSGISALKSATSAAVELSKACVEALVLFSLSRLACASAATFTDSTSTYAVCESHDASILSPGLEL